MPSVQLNIRARRMLLADWFEHLARESGLDFKQQGTSGQTFILGAPNEFHVTAHFIETPPYLRFVASDPDRQALVDALVARAVELVERGDFGGLVWYTTSLHETDFRFSLSAPIGPLLQHLSSQTRVVGWRRLGLNVLLEFAEVFPEDWEEKPQLLAPKAVVHIHIAAQAPCAGYFSSYAVHRIVEILVAICTFALGRAIPLPPTVFPSKPELLSQLEAERINHEILTLARKHISLDIFNSLAIPGAYEHFARVRAALLSFDAAVRQEHDSVSCILYVIAAESLAVPNTTWRKEKLTKRFIEFFDELMPAELDQIVAHANFEEVFGIRREKRTARRLRRELLDRIYDYRSGRLHEGLRPTYRGMGLDFDAGDEVRRGLFMDFAEGAILRYLASPRTSLIGHPAFDERVLDR